MKRNEQACAGPGPGHKPVFLKGLCIGLGVMAIQLVLLLDSFDLYVQGKGGRIWQLATAGGLVLLGGLVSLWVLHSAKREPDQPIGWRVRFARPKPRTSPRHAA
jgi:hypothetical protein